MAQKEQLVFLEAGCCQKRLPVKNKMKNNIYIFIGSLFLILFIVLFTSKQVEAQIKTTSDTKSEAMSIKSGLSDEKQRIKNDHSYTIEIPGYKSIFYAKDYTFNPDSQSCIIIDSGTVICGSFIIRDNI